MTPRQRTLAALAFEDVHPVPYTIWHDHETMEKLNRYYGHCDWQGRIVNHIDRITVNWDPKCQLDERHYRDIFGTVWRAGDPPHVEAPALQTPSLAGYNLPRYSEYLKNSVSEKNSGHTILPALSFEDTRQRLRDTKHRAFTVVGFGFGIFESAWIIRGFENFLMDLLLEPTFAHDLVDLLLNRQLELLDELLKLPCDGIIFSDDYGDQRTLLIGPDLWRTFIKPRLARLYERVQQHGKLTFHHSCGNVYEIIEDLIEIGLDVLQSLQPEAMPVYEIKKRFGHNLRLWGGIGTQELLPFGPPGRIQREIRQLKGQLGAGGGYVLSTSKPIMKEVPAEHAVACIEEMISTD